MFRKLKDLYKSKGYLIFASLFILSIVPFIWKLSNKINAKSNRSELFQPELYYINSVDKAIKYTDSIYKVNEFQNFDTSAYVQIASDFTKKRFYYGLSHYSLSDNWIAYLSGKVLWNHLSAIVNPSDILKHQEGLCSQQTIVFMELLKRKGVNIRSIGLGYVEGPGHFLSEVHYNGSWHLFDVTMEPSWEKIAHHHQSMSYYQNNKDSLYLAYESTYDKPLYNKLLERVVYGKINEFPAKKMSLFHQLTLLFTYIFPFIFLFLFIRGYKTRK